MHMHVLVLWITNESATAKIISLRQIYYISGQIMEQTTFLLYLELLWFSSSSKSSSEEKLGECALLFSSRHGEKYPESILSCWIEKKCFFNLYFSVFCKRVYLFHRSMHEEIYAVITWVKHVLFLCFMFFFHTNHGHSSLFFTCSEHWAPSNFLREQPCDLNRIQSFDRFLDCRSGNRTYTVPVNRTGTFGEFVRLPGLVLASFIKVK